MIPQKETAKTLSPWSKRWADSYTGWHKDDVHHFLLKYGEKVIPSFTPSPDACSDENSTTRILFPLCGKTVDMAFLANHPAICEVVGVDGVQKAFDEFSEEHPTLKIKKEGTHGAVEKFLGDKISLLRGDFFDIDDQMTGGKFDCIFDRASLVAIQPHLREKYIGVIGKLIKQGGSILLVTLDRREGTEEAKKTGPPFSVNEMEVSRLFNGLDWVESVTKLEELDEFEAGGEDVAQRFKSAGLISMFELCLLIKAKD